MKRKLTERARIALAAVIGATAVATVAVTAGVGFARDSVGAAQYQYGNKVTICHHTHSKSNPFVTIRVSPKAVKAHMRHGDTMGACTSGKTKGKGHKPAPQQPTQPTTTPATQPSTTPSHGNGNGNGNGKPDDPGSNGNGHGKGKTK